jgi:hypothetical protein
MPIQYTWPAERAGISTLIQCAIPDTGTFYRVQITKRLTSPSNRFLLTSFERVAFRLEPEMLRLLSVTQFEWPDRTSGVFNRETPVQGVGTFVSRVRLLWSCHAAAVERLAAKLHLRPRRSCKEKEPLNEVLRLFFNHLRWGVAFIFDFCSRTSMERNPFFCPRDDMDGRRSTGNAARRRDNREPVDAADWQDAMRFDGEPDWSRLYRHNQHQYGHRQLHCRPLRAAWLGHI